MKFNLPKIKLPKLSEIKCPEFVKNHKKLSIVIGIALIILIVFLIVNAFKKDDAGATSEFVEHTVAKGDVRVVISGSGAIEANEQYEITALVTGDVLTANFEEGDIVEEGDILYEIDTKNIENSIEKAKNSLETAKMSYDDALEDVTNLNVKAPCSGNITNVYVKSGDSVSKGTKIADVIDTSTMNLKIPFNSNDAANLYVGQSITVKLDLSGYTLNGRISRISTGTTTSSSGVSVKMVDIEVKNPGTLREGERAIAYTSLYACNEAGTFEVNEKETIIAEVAGDLAWIAIDVGDQVSSGQKIAQIKSKSASNNAKKSELSYKDAQLNLDNLYENMEDYTITAPISGTVISKETKAGDKLDNTNKSTVMAVIADMSRMLFKISVDELDIAKLEVGQKVSVTADALEGKIFSGYIDKISIIGTTSNGVTTYPVTVVVNDPEGLIPGMNVDAQITVEEAKDVITVPVSAVMRGNMVAVKSSEKPQEPKSAPEGAPNKNGMSGAPTGKGGMGGNRAFGLKLPDGYVLRPVKIGISNSDYVQIVSGLEEGDIILIQQTNTTTSLTDMMTGGAGMGGARMGGMGGMSGPPSGMGGARSGGMGGGSR